MIDLGCRIYPTEKERKEMLLPLKPSNTYKMLIVLDKELIEAESICSYSELQEKIRLLTREENMRIDSSGWYANGTMETCLILIGAFKNLEWFRHYVKEWKIIDTVDGGIEDVLVTYPQV